MAVVLGFILVIVIAGLLMWCMSFDSQTTLNVLLSGNYNSARPANKTVSSDIGSKVKRVYYDKDIMKVPVKERKCGIICGQDMSAFGLKDSDVVFYKNIDYSIDLSDHIGDFIIIKNITYNSNPFIETDSYYGGGYIRKLIGVYNTEDNDVNGYIKQLMKYLHPFETEWYNQQSSYELSLVTQFNYLKEKFPDELYYAVVCNKCNFGTYSFNVIPLDKVVGLVKYIQHF